MGSAGNKAKHVPALDLFGDMKEPKVRGPTPVLQVFSLFPQVGIFFLQFLDPVVQIGDVVLIGADSEFKLRNLLSKSG